MHTGPTVFKQLLQFLPRYEFNLCVRRHRGEYREKKFSTYDQFLCLAYAQMAGRESLRDIETCLNSHQEKLYHIGFRGDVSRTTLADANERRDWRIFQDFGHVLIGIAQQLYQADAIAVELTQPLYAFDSTTIDLCLTLFPWAEFRKTKAAVKMHTLIDLRGPIPTWVTITTGKVHDVRMLDHLPVAKDAIYTMDRGYVDFARLHSIHKQGAFFVVRAKDNLKCQRLYSHPKDKESGVRADQIITLVTQKSKKGYPEKLRRVSYVDKERNKRLVFLTNNFEIPAATVAAIYKQRWQVELFFKWIKQHLRIKSFIGTSVNAVKSQIWVALCIYLLVAITKKKLGVPCSLYTFLQILEVNLFEKKPISSLVAEALKRNADYPERNQLNLFNY
ncbi:transposase IS4 family protein [Geobacter metallireducens RCH3]|uniref:Transposase of ISGme2, IS4 family n=2 Tax=Geobacter metallireducens TaxID=28232 RepID=Q39V10_GEOMG|nr:MULTISPECIES: IS4-like element ISGme2 family transposase [Geobacter]ABB31551.1 transposase of ISGme2, IS4 family [Geobacter metallireducens GS-15]ABB31914.1 transposase of ISGme2, IS4 family [Geobacter metallireducens GS-15]ABB32611.1 transposase of ISGme2, IS4 family [Geobacter metallireducens GS-15]ABB32729.1 transposase of ISGme2, IS4 family [Geobacter metallireducens GS-15]ABB33254.1 transposase of ISGme2, IS4 family [Geobacter metallireducens GS-15]